MNRIGNVFDVCMCECVGASAICACVRPGVQMSLHQLFQGSWERCGG